MRLTPILRLKIGPITCKNTFGNDYSKKKKKNELETGINSTSKKKITFETFTKSLGIDKKLATNEPKSSY